MSDSDTQLKLAISQISSTIAELDLTPASRTPQPTSPIHQLPTELLSLVFDFSCPINLLQEYSWICGSIFPTKLSSAVITYLPALAISAVCAKWRCLAMALPSLWSRLKLEISEDSTSNLFMATLQLYLERSAHDPLFVDLYIGLVEDDYEVYDDMPSAPLDLLLEHTRRWKSFRCITDRKISETPLSLPILEDAAADNLQCFQIAPKLRALTTEGETKFLSQSIQHQLTSLNTALTIEEMDHLQGFYNLMTLELLASGYEIDQPPLISIHRLKSFTLTLHPLLRLWNYGRCRDFMHQVLPMFTFPSLTEFIICCKRVFLPGQLDWSANAFEAFISRSSCVLTTLSIGGIAVSDRDFIAALHLLPSLTKLIYDDFRAVVHPITSFFLSSLTLHESDSVPEPHSILVPNLCALSLKCDGTSFDDSAFVEMVTSRWLPDPLYAATIGVASLRSVVLRFREREVDEDVYRGLYELDKVGMQWGREVNEEADMPLRAKSNLERMGMRVVITGKDFMGV